MNELSSLVLLGVSFGLAFFGSWFVLKPMIEGVVTPDDQAEQGADALATAQLQKEEKLTELEELEYGRLSGLVSEQDYQQSRAELFQEIGKID